MHGMPISSVAPRGAKGKGSLRGIGCDFAEPVVAGLVIVSADPLRFNVEELPVDAVLSVFLWSLVEANSVALLLPLIVIALEVGSCGDDTLLPLLFVDAIGFLFSDPATDLRTVTAGLFATDAAVDTVDTDDLAEDAIDGGRFEVAGDGLNLFESATGGRFEMVTRGFATDVVDAVDVLRDRIGELEVEVEPAPAVRTLKLEFVDVVDVRLERVSAVLYVPTLSLVVDTLDVGLKGGGRNDEEPVEDLRTVDACEWIDEADDLGREAAVDMVPVLDETAEVTLGDTLDLLDVVEGDMILTSVLGRGVGGVGSFSRSSVGSIIEGCGVGDVEGEGVVDPVDGGVSLESGRSPKGGRSGSLRRGDGPAVLLVPREAVE